tara:strand:- start:1243 stop:1494 length:252 start_codon:yes stop_codon:yes gene_type:complete
MKLQDILKTELNERSDVKDWLKQLVKSYQSYYKPAQKFPVGDVIQALGGKKRLLLLYRRGISPRKAAIYLTKTPPGKRKGVKW